MPSLHARWLPPLAALALLLATWFTASTVPLLDPDEGFYPATAAESVRSGDWWDLRFNGAPRWDKPVLAYALIEGAFATFGRSTGTARLPSALEAAALVLIAAALLRRLAGADAAALSAVVLATSFGVHVFARAAHPEIAVVASIAITQLLIAIWLIVPEAERPSWVRLAIGLSLGYGLLAKGPVAVVVPALGAAVAAPFLADLRARWRAVAIDGLVAGSVALAVAAPWYIAMTRRHGPVFLEEALWQQNVGRYIGQLPEHHASVAFFILPAAVAMLPWSAFVVPALRRIRRRPADRRDALRFCMAVFAATSFIFYSLSVSKLAAYALVFVPPLSVVVGLYLEEQLRAAGPRGVAVRSVAVVLMLTGVGLFALPLLPPHLSDPQSLLGGVPGADAEALLFWTVLPVALVLVLGATAVSLTRGIGRIATLAALGLVLPVVVIAAARPAVLASYPWERFGMQIAAAPAPAWVYGFRTPSLSFYAGQPVIRVTEPARLESILGTPGAGWIVVDETMLESVRLSQRIGARTGAVIDRAGRLALVRLS